MPANVAEISTPRAVIVHSGARDGYHLAIALAQVQLLEGLVTDVYLPADRMWFKRSFGSTMSASSVSRRYADGLPSPLVLTSKMAFIHACIAHTAKGGQSQRRKDDALSILARKVAVKRNVPLFAYSYYAFKAFEAGPNRPTSRFLFQLHPHPATVRALLHDELERTPTARESLLQEQELALPAPQFQALCDEPQLANGWVVASSFTKRTLVEHGIPADAIHVVPYGVDRGRFAARTGHPASDTPFTIVFVGSMIQRKGLSDLLDAVRMISSRHVRVKLCGRGLIDRALLASYDDLPLELHEGLATEALVREMQDSDVFVLPSLAEGFGHVILEAMATGLPVITTDHTAGPDLIRQGDEGFIVPIRSPEAVAEKLTWCIEHRDALTDMGQAAANRAQLFPWDRFHAGIVRAYRAMCARQHFGALSCTDHTWDERGDASTAENAL